MPVPPEQLLLSYIPIWILKLIYPIEEDLLQRDRDLKVICVGLGRTGTDSLRTALSELGYDDVAHGWYVVAKENMPRAIQLERLNRAKYGPHPSPSYLSTLEFDKVFGHCAALTDAPAASHASELLRAYPNAKVIMNRRKDIDKWHASQLATIDKINTDWPSWARQFFDSEAFWIGRMLYWAKKQTNFNFAVEGRGHYKRHYECLEKELRGMGREYLDWTVEDGWVPLCKFLGEKVPSREFPNENNAGSFDKRRAEMHMRRAQSADRRMKVVAVGVVAVVLAGVAWIALG